MAHAHNAGAGRGSPVALRQRAGGATDAPLREQPVVVRYLSRLVLRELPKPTSPAPWNIIPWALIAESHSSALGAHGPVRSNGGEPLDPFYAKNSER